MGERRAGRAAAAHGSGRVTISSLADLPWSGERRQHRRGTLLRHPPLPLPKGMLPKGKVQNAICLAYKVLGCRASFEEGEKRSCRGPPAGKRSSPGSGRSLAPGTLRASRKPVRMEQGALNRTGDSGAGTGRVRRCFTYPRPREDSNKSCPSHFITLPARADSGRAEPGADLALPRAFLCTSYATPRVCAAQGGRPVPGEAPGALCVGAGCLLPAAPRRWGARTYLCSARTGGLSAGIPCLGGLRADWWRRSLAPGRR